MYPACNLMYLGMATGLLTALASGSSASIAPRSASRASPTASECLPALRLAWEGDARGWKRM